MKQISENRPNRFARTREAHRSELGQDYSEVILDLVEDTGEARLTDIAAKLGVTHPTVSKALKKMQNEGLVQLRAYRAVQLTEAGRQLALSCRIRHKTVLEFLLALGLDAETAEFDSEGIEHHVSERTLELMRQFTLTQMPGPIVTDN